MKFLRFILVGGCAASVQLLSLGLCLQVLNLANQVAIVIAYSTSVFFHYFANRYFTFQVKKKLNVLEVMRYLSVVLTNLLITFTITTVTVDTLQMNAYIGTVFSILTTVGIAFFTSKYWIFSYEVKSE